MTDVKITCPKCGTKDWTTVNLCMGCVRTEKPITLALHECHDSIVHSMTVARLGGTVEGNPTAKHNFLQRVDELREIERRYWRLSAAMEEIINTTPGATAAYVIADRTMNNRPDRG